MKKRFLLTACFVFGFFLLAQSQAHGPQAELSRSFHQAKPFYQNTQKDSLAIWREQVLLHTDSEVYKPKETLFFKAYVLTGPKQLRISASTVLRVELLDTKGNLVIDQYHRIEKGSTDGIIELPKKIDDGKYYLRAYTRWMLNYGEESLPVKEILVSKSKKGEDYKNRSISIVAEGGHFVTGLENRVVISDSDGGAINGAIIDEKGMLVAQVMDYGSGLATFTFVPGEGETYYFERREGEKIRLAPSLEEGAVLHASNINDEKIQVRVGITEGLQDGTYYLKGTNKDKEYITSEIKFDNNKDFVEVDIKKEGLPEGLLHLTLVDAYDQIWAERPFYIGEKNLRFSFVEESRPIEEGKRKVRYKLRLIDVEGNPVSSEVMVSIKNVDNIADAMAQASDERGISFLKDLKVLAQRFPETTSMAPENELPDQISYSFQNGLEFYGQAYDLNNSLLANDKIQIFIKDKKDIEVREVDTNSKGLFTLTGLQFEGEVTMTFRREGKNVKEQLVKVIPYRYELPKLQMDKGAVVEAREQVQQSGQMIPQKRLSDFDFEDKPSNLIALEAVTLIGQRKLGKVSASVYGIEPSRVVYQNPERPKTLPELFLGIPGVYVSGLGDLNPSLVLPAMAGAGPVLWVVDGFPLSQDSYYAPPLGAATSSASDFISFGNDIDNSASSGTQPSKLREVMDMVPFSDVERIELLFGANAAIYGTRGSGGVIMIYTNQGAYSTESVNRNEAQITFEGFQPPIDVEDYFASKKRKSSKTKSLSTLYWNPTLRTDENGEASLEFIVPKNLKSVLLDVKTITPEGKRGTLSSLSRL